MLSIRRAIAPTLAICIMGAGFPVNSYAGMIPSEAVIPAPERERILSVLDRADVRLQLEALGVTRAEVSGRVAALTDAEVAQLVQQIDPLPAGGDAGVGAVLGAIVLVFLILLITDILGLTKVFPFTKPIR